VLFVGRSDLAEIAALCALDHGITIAGLVQDGRGEEGFIGLPVFTDFEAVTQPFDAVLITDVINARATCQAAVARYGLDRVLVPDLLRVRIRQQGGAAE
jgi:hypothetical protein